MAVNSASRLLERCRAAQAVHGAAPVATSQTQPETIHPPQQATLQPGSDPGSSSGGMGPAKMGEMAPAGKGRRFYQTEADKALDDAALMKKIAKGWQAFGEHPWWVVHGKPEKQMARFNSDSALLRQV